MKSTLKKIIRHTPFINDWYEGRKFKRQNENFPMTFKGKDADILNALLAKGYYVLENYTGKRACDTARKKFLETVKTYPHYVRIREDKRIFGAEHTSAEAMEFFKDPYLQSISDQYYGEPSVVGTLLVNQLEKKDDENLGSGGDWHRDRYLRQFKAIVYLSDVTEENGPFQYIEASNTNPLHDTTADMACMGYPPYETRFDHDKVKKLIDKDPRRLISFAAKKGTVILVDTSGIHRGMPLQSGERFAMFNYYYPVREYDHDVIAKKMAPLLPADYKD